MYLQNSFFIAEVKVASDESKMTVVMKAKFVAKLVDDDVVTVARRRPGQGGGLLRRRRRM